MAEYRDEQFKTTLMGGYDKEDVQNQFRMLKDTAHAEKSKLTNELEEKEKIITEKDEIIASKNEEIEKLKKDISEKYQSYIDNYDTIGKLVYETRVNSEKTINEANEQKEKIISDANAQAEEKLEKAQREVDKVMSDGKRRYAVLQEEINELISLVNQVQHKFMKSFKAIHEISSTMEDDSFDGFDPDEGFDEEDGI